MWPDGVIRSSTLLCQDFSFCQRIEALTIKGSFLKLSGLLMICFAISRFLGIDLPSFPSTFYLKSKLLTWTRFRGAGHL